MNLRPLVIRLSLFRPVSRHPSRGFWRRRDSHFRSSQVRQPRSIKTRHARMNSDRKASFDSSALRNHLAALIWGRAVNSVSSPQIGFRPAARGATMISIRCQSFSSIYCYNDNAPVAPSLHHCKGCERRCVQGSPKPRKAGLAVILNCYSLFESRHDFDMRFSAHWKASFRNAPGDYRKRY
jgi:hypothetical protein